MASGTGEGSKVSEDLVGVRCDVPDPVRLPDDPLRIDDVRPPLRSVGIRFGRSSLGLVGLSNRLVDIGEQTIGEPEPLGEGPVLVRRIEGDAEDDRVGLLELGGSVTEPLALARSAGGVGLHVPPQHDPPSPQVRESDGPAVLVGEGEVRRLDTFLEHGPQSTLATVVEFTDWAKDILTRSQQAARRFNPDAVIRLARAGAEVQAMLAEGPEPGDQAEEVDGVTVYVESGLDGLVDVEEPHDRLVLRPEGSPPNVRGEH